MNDVETSFRNEITRNGWQTRVGADVVATEVEVDPVVAMPYDGTETAGTLPKRAEHQVNPDRADLPA